MCSSLAFCVGFLDFGHTLSPHHVVSGGRGAGHQQPLELRMRHGFGERLEPCQTFYFPRSRLKQYIAILTSISGCSLADLPIQIKGRAGQVRHPCTGILSSMGALRCDSTITCRVTTTLVITVGPPATFAVHPGGAGGLEVAGRGFRGKISLQSRFRDNCLLCLSLTSIGPPV